MKKIVEMWNELMSNVPTVIEAILLLCVALLCAFLVKYLVEKTLKILGIDKAFQKANMDGEKRNSFVDFMSKLAYLVTFILFVPGIFQKLGLTGVAEPVVAMMNKLLTYLPNIVAASIILIIGLLVAKIVKELLLPLFQKLKIDSYLEKAGFEESSKVKPSEVLANGAYTLILIPVVIAALDALKIDAISKPAIEMLNRVIVFMPRIIIAIAILFVGRFIANLVSKLLEKVLLSIGTDKATEKVLKASNTNTSSDFSLSHAISSVVKYVIIIFFLVEGINILQLEVLTKIGSDIIAYMPYAISSMIIMGIAIIVGNYVENQINNKFEKNKVLGLILKSVIITIGSFITLYQLGIAKELVNGAFMIILGALAVAFAVSFGIGGRDFASHMLKKVEDRLDTKKK